MGILIQLETSARLPNHGILMPGVYSCNTTGRDFIKSEPDGYEHGVFFVLQHIQVGTGHNFRRGKAGLGIVLDHVFCHHHEQRSGDSFAGDICNHERKVRFIQNEEIIEIPADLSCGRHGCREGKGIAFRKMPLQNRLLYFTGQFQFSLYALTFLRQLNILLCVAVNLGNHL